MNRATHNDGWVRNPDGTLGYTCSLITGCRLGHDYCFAMKQANGRLRSRYLANENIAPEVMEAPLGDVLAAYENPFYPRFWADRLERLDRFLAGSRKLVGVFLNIMGEWAGDWVPREWQDAQFGLINRHPRHRIYLLTHCPQNLPKFSPFSNNCYVGVTATDGHKFVEALNELEKVRAKIIYLSLEPLLNWHIEPDVLLRDLKTARQLDWLIIGAMTGRRKDIFDLYHLNGYSHLTPMLWGKRWTLQPKVEWVEEIVRAADQAGVPVFLKDNLAPLLCYPVEYSWAYSNNRGFRALRQEMPA